MRLANQPLPAGTTNYYGVQLQSVNHQASHEPVLNIRYPLLPHQSTVEIEKELFFMKVVNMYEYKIKK